MVYADICERWKIDFKTLINNYTRAQVELLVLGNYIIQKMAECEAKKESKEGAKRSKMSMDELKNFDPEAYERYLKESGW